MNRWVEGYYGKRDAMGQFILTEEQKYQAVEAQKRAISMLNANPDLTMSQAYQIAVGSVSGNIGRKQAEELAALDAEEQGIAKTLKNAFGNDKPNPQYDEFVQERASQIMNTSQVEAESLYNQIVGSQQQVRQPQRQQVQQQPQAQQPQQGLNVQQPQARQAINTNHVLTMPNGRKITQEEIEKQAEISNISVEEVVNILKSRGAK